MARSNDLLGMAGLDLFGMRTSSSAELQKMLTPPAYIQKEIRKEQQAQAQAQTQKNFTDWLDNVTANVLNDPLYRDSDVAYKREILDEWKGRALPQILERLGGDVDLEMLAQEHTLGAMEADYKEQVKRVKGGQINKFSTKVARGIRPLLALPDIGGEVTANKMLAYSQSQLDKLNTAMERGRDADGNYLVSIQRKLTPQVGGGRGVRPMYQPDIVMTPNELDEARKKAASEVGHYQHLADAYRVAGGIRRKEEAELRAYEEMTQPALQDVARMEARLAAQGATFPQVQAELARPGVVGKLAGVAGVVGEALPTSIAAIGAGIGGAIVGGPTAGVAAGAATGFALGGAMGYEEAQSRFQSLPRNEIEQTPGYKKLVDSGISPNQALLILADESASLSGVIAGVVESAGNIVGGEALIAGIGPMKQLLSRLGSGAVRKLAVGATWEAGTEALQEGTQQYMSGEAINIVLGRQVVDPWEGVPDAMAIGALAGAGLGAVGGGLEARRGRIAAETEAERQRIEDLRLVASRANALWPDLLDRANQLPQAGMEKERVALLREMLDARIPARAYQNAIGNVAATAAHDRAIRLLAAEIQRLAPAAPAPRARGRGAGPRIVSQVTPPVTPAPAAPAAPGAPPVTPAPAAPAAPGAPPVTPAPAAPAAPGAPPVARTSQVESLRNRVLAMGSPTELAQDLANLRSIEITARTNPEMLSQLDRMIADFTNKVVAMESGTPTPAAPAPPVAPTPAAPAPPVAPTPAAPAPPVAPTPAAPRSFQQRLTSARAELVSLQAAGEPQATQLLQELDNIRYTETVITRADGSQAVVPASAEAEARLADIAQRTEALRGPGEEVEVDLTAPAQPVPTPEQVRKTISQVLEEGGWRLEDIQPGMPVIEAIASAFERLGMKPLADRIRTGETEDGPTLGQPALHGTAAEMLTNFDWDYIGTGEGAQAFGQGFYLTEPDEVGQDLTRRYANTAARNRQGKVAYDTVLAGERYYQNEQDQWVNRRTQQQVSPAVADLLGVISSQIDKPTGRFSRTKRELEQISELLDMLALETTKVRIEGTKLIISGPGMLESSRAAGGFNIPRIKKAISEVRRAMNAGEQFMGQIGFGETELEARLYDRLQTEERVVSRELNTLSQRAQDIRSALFKRDPARGVVYQVEIPENSGLLQWDLPLNQQPEKIQKAVDELKSRHNLTITETVEFEDLSTGGISTLDQSSTGKDFYYALAAALGSERAASEAFARVGIPGHRFWDGSTRHLDGAKRYNFVIWDTSKAADFTRTLYQNIVSQEGDAAPRAAYQRLQNGIVKLMRGKDADPSSLPHEFMHVFLDEALELLNTGKVPEQLASAFSSDINTLLNWASDGAVTSWEGFNAQSPEYVAIQEKIARGFEMYLLRGVAPEGAPAEVVTAFSRMKNLLSKIYRSAVDYLGGRLRPEVRRVFDNFVTGYEAITEEGAAPDVTGREAIEAGVETVTPGEEGPGAAAPAVEPGYPAEVAPVSPEDAGRGLGRAAQPSPGAAEISPGAVEAVAEAPVVEPGYGVLGQEPAGAVRPGEPELASGEYTDAERLEADALRSSEGFADLSRVSDRVLELAEESWIDDVMTDPEYENASPEREQEIALRQEQLTAPIFDGFSNENPTSTMSEAQNGNVAAQGVLENNREHAPFPAGVVGNDAEDAASALRIADTATQSQRPTTDELGMTDTLVLFQPSFRISPAAQAELTATAEAVNALLGQGSPGAVSNTDLQSLLNGILGTSLPSQQGRAQEVYGSGPSRQEEWRSKATSLREITVEAEAPLLVWLADKLNVTTGHPEDTAVIKEFDLIAGKTRQFRNNALKQFMEPVLREAVTWSKKLGLSVEDVMTQYIGEGATTRHSIEDEPAWKQRLYDNVEKANNLPERSEKQRRDKWKAITKAETMVEAYDAWQADPDAVPAPTRGGMRLAERQALWDKMVDDLGKVGITEAEFRRVTQLVADGYKGLLGLSVREGVVTQEEVDQFPDWNFYVPTNTRKAASKIMGNDGRLFISAARSDYYSQGSRTRALDAVTLLYKSIENTSRQVGNWGFLNELSKVRDFLIQRDGHDHGLKMISEDSRRFKSKNNPGAFNEARRIQERGGLSFRPIVQRGGKAGRETLRFFFQESEQAKLSEEDAVRLTKAMGVVGKSNAVVESIAEWTRFHSTFYTVGTVAFSPINSAKDVTERMFVTAAQESYRKEDGSLVSGHAVAAQMFKLLLHPQATVDYGAAFFKGEGSDSRFGRWFNEFRDSGANFTQAQHLLSKPDSFSNTMKKAKGFRRMYEASAGILRRWGDFFNMYPAFLQYAAYREAGVGAKDAANYVLKTMNFHKRGLITPTAQAFAPFFVSTMQTGINLVRALSPRGKETLIGKAKPWAIMTGLTMAGTQLIGMLIAGAGEDDNGVNRWDALTFEQKMAGIPLWDDEGNRYTVPVGFGGTLLAWGLANIIHDVSEGSMSMTDGAFNLVHTVFKNTIPGSMPSHDFTENPTAWMFQFFTPYLARPVADLATNTNNWGSKITNEDYRPIGVRRAAYGRPTTPTWAHQAANWIQETLGYDTYPEAIRHFASYYAAGPLQGILTYLEKDDLNSPMHVSTRTELGPVLSILGASRIYNPAMNISRMEYYNEKSRIEKQLDSRGVRLADVANKTAEQKRAFIINGMRRAGFSNTDIQMYSLILEGDKELTKVNRQFKQESQGWLTGPETIVRQRFVRWSETQKAIMDRYIRRMMALKKLDRGQTLP